MDKPNLKEIISNEYKKIANDFIYGIKKYCQVETIKNGAPGKFAFELFDFQEK